jgi:glutathione S-transferase
MTASAEERTYARQKIVLYLAEKYSQRELLPSDLELGHRE